MKLIICTDHKTATIRLTAEQAAKASTLPFEAYLTPRQLVRARRVELSATSGETARVYVR